VKPRVPVTLLGVPHDTEPDVLVASDADAFYRAVEIKSYPDRAGKAIHHVLRHVAEAARASGTIPDAEALRALIDTEFYPPFADALAFDRMYGAATRLVEGYVTRWASHLRRVWAIERPFELHLDGGTVTGRADVILDGEEGRMGSLALLDTRWRATPSVTSATGSSSPSTQLRGAEKDSR
jgi:PD-(D/E)XK nuclease superfamily